MGRDNPGPAGPLGRGGGHSSSWSRRMSRRVTGDVVENMDCTRCAVSLYSACMCVHVCCLQVRLLDAMLSLSGGRNFKATD